ncbi:MAG: TetR/AcrR family transcriptional regulator [Allobranchiibius sp.]
MVRERKDADVRRVEILDATIGQIEEHGTALLRIADVAAALEVSPALIVYHFQTKEDLIAQAFASAAQRDLDKLIELTEVDESALERLRVALAWYAPTGRAKGWRLWIEGWAEGLRQPILQQVGSDFDAAWRGALIAIIEEGVAAGEFSTTDAFGAAWRITALLDGLAVQVIVHHGLVTREQLIEWTMQTVAHELGLKPDPTAVQRAKDAVAAGAAG